MSRREVVVGGDRVVVAARLLLAAPHDERPEHVGRVERLGRARDAQRRVAPPGGREGGGEAEAKRGVSGLLLGLSEESRNVGGRDGGGSATGLRRTLAIPGRASSSEEICDPPSSAGGGGGGIEQAAPALKVAPSYIPPWGPSRIFAVTTAGTRGWGGDAGAAPRRDRRACGARW